MIFWKRFVFCFFFFSLFLGIKLGAFCMVGKNSYSELYPRWLEEELNGIFWGSSSHNVISGLSLPFSLPHFFLFNYEFIFYVYILSLSISFLLSLSFSLFVLEVHRVYIMNFGFEFLWNSWVWEQVCLCIYICFLHLDTFLSFYMFCLIPLCF